MFQSSDPKKSFTKKRIIFWSIVSVVIIAALISFIVASISPRPSFAIANSNVLAIDAPLEFNFTIPVSRQVEVSVTPNVYGAIRYSDSIMSEHLARKVIFTPELTWRPDTTYEVVVTNVKSALPTYRQPDTYTFVFSTPAAPDVTSVSPAKDTVISPRASWDVMLSDPPGKLARYDFSISPEIGFTTAWDEQATSYRITPDKRLSQGQTYQLKVTRQHIRWKWGTEELGFQAEPALIWEGSWTVPEAPGITSVSLHGDAVAIDDPLFITFSENIAFASLQEQAVIEPAIQGQWSTQDYLTVTFEPADDWAMDTAYTVTLPAGLETNNGGYLIEDAVYKFSTVGPVTMTRSYPAHGATGVSIGSSMEILFDQPVDKISAEQAFSINPAVSGSFSWIDGQTIVFDPQDNLSFNTGYTITLAAGIQGANGPASAQAQTISFATELSVTKLSVPFHRQEHNLSCEIATLVMALEYYDISVSEAALINMIGFDSTPKQDGVWGNPHIAFVGDIDGHQPSTGYGVYWQPIAQAAQHYREAEWFSGWSLPQLTAEIQAGHPVIVWGTAGSGSRIDWKTPDGDNVVAVNGEHTYVVIGYIGSAENPSKIITLDPLSGEKTFTQSSFLWNWGTLGNSGVVVK